MADTDIQYAVSLRDQPLDLYDSSNTEKPSGESWNSYIRKMPAPSDKEEQSSDQGVNLGLKAQPFDFRAAIAFKDQNPHHSACIEAKSRALSGLGFVDDTVADTLDPLCDSTFLETLNSIAEDYWQVGNGYMEVVRKEGSDQIVGLHHVPASDVRICIQDATYNRYFIVGFGGEGINPVIMAPFGERKEFQARMKDPTPSSKRMKRRADLGMGGYYTALGGFGSPSYRSEIIHFARRTSMSRWYGYPDWLSAIPNIELVQCATQERYDYYYNRGVPEIILSITGAMIDAKTWTGIKTAIESTIGPRNQHKTMALNVKDPTAKVQVDKLSAGDSAGGETAFATMNEALALAIVTAHRTPPVIANIQIPGKLGAVNELPNALMAFQVLVIGPEQTSFQAILSETLGNRKLNGGLALRPKNFKLKKITEEIPLGLGQQQPGEHPGQGNAVGAGMKQLDTMSRMRTPAATAGGRDLSRGVKK